MLEFIGNTSVDIGLKKNPEHKLNVWLKKQINEAFRDSVRAFITAATEAMAVDTGMSVASFRPLSDRVGRGSLHTMPPRVAKRPGHRKAYISGFQNNVAPWKSESLGQRLGQKAFVFKVLNSTKDTKLSFRFMIKVLQHFIHEDTRLTQRTMAKGMVAFSNMWDHQISRRLTPDQIENFLFTQGSLSTGYMRPDKTVQYSKRR